MHVLRMHRHILGRVALVVQRKLPVDDLSVSVSVRMCVCASVCLVHCGKMVDQIRMPFGIVGSSDEAGGGVLGSVHGNGYF